MYKIDPVADRTQPSEWEASRPCYLSRLSWWEVLAAVFLWDERSGGLWYRHREVQGVQGDRLAQKEWVVEVD
jgi:hypothetical protein